MTTAKFLGVDTGLDYEGIWLVMYSKSQECYHIDLASKDLRDLELTCLDTGWPWDYVTIGICSSHKTAHLIATNHKQIRDGLLARQKGFE